jgi:2-oxoglutarate/2-oxoacid ferredoxin oxidoreductase subunit alpha
MKGYLKRDDLEGLLRSLRQYGARRLPRCPLRKMVVNIMYVGVVAYLFDLKMDEVGAAVEKQFAGKAKAAELNNAAQIAFDWARENLEKERFVLQPSDRAKGKIIIEGNEAAALGMLFGGVQVVAWYPITPSSSLCETSPTYLDEYRRDPVTGKATYAVIQAEDELASIAMVSARLGRRPLHDRHLGPRHLAHG